MRSLLLPVFRAVAVAGCAFAAGRVDADVLFNIDAGILRNANGTPAPNSTLLIVAADTLNDGFQGPSPSAFATGDDVELFRWSLNSFDVAGHSGPFAFPLTTAQISAIPNLTSGDPLRLYWYPTLLQSAPSPGFGTPYGSFSSATPVNGSIAWNFPGDTGGTFTLNFLTPAYKPDSPLSESQGNASNLTPVPEPATFSAIAAAGCLAFGALVRRSRRG